LTIPVRKRNSEAGQAAVLVVLAMSVFLVGAVGLAIDGSHLYAERQMAQAAADSAAQAGIRSMFTGSNGSGTSGFSTSASFTCASSSTKTPCYYAQTLNGFNASNDTVKVDFPAASTVVPAGVLSASDPTAIRVTVSRQVQTTLFKLISSWTPTVAASATAAVVSVVSPTPIIVTHPSLVGALNMNGTTSISIVGGPQRSIEVDSNGTYPSAGTAYQGPSSGSVDLHLAGPNGTGGDFGVFGAPATNPGNVNVGSTGQYIGTAPPIPDPFAGVSAPTTTGLATPPQNGQACTVLGHCSNCPAPGFTGTAPTSCQEYLPGIYSSLDLTSVNSAIFDPGVYYIQGGGFTLKNDTVQMCTSCTADPNTANGMVIYDTGTTSTNHATGGFTVDTGANAILYGAGVSTANLHGAPTSPYYGILFFEDRNANAHTGNGKNGAHILGQGNGCFSVVGTIYITNTQAIMQATPAQYQEVKYHGTPCSSTVNVGQIIVSALDVVGTSSLNMQLYSTGFLTVRQLALVQ